MTIKIPVSVGELIDRISIILIKRIHIQDEKIRNELTKEYKELITILDSIENDQFKKKMLHEMITVNTTLWNCENWIRKMEAKEKFGKKFIATARNIYKLNDKRSKIKNKINKEYGSQEEIKQYE